MICDRSPSTHRLAICALALNLCTAGAPAHAAAPGSTFRRPLPAAIEQFVQADLANRPAPCQVLFVGSSSIARWKSLASDLAPLPVINRGFDGAHIESFNQWFDQVVAPYRPRVIVFYAGENDVAAGKPVESVVADFDAFMARKSEALRQVPVYFISLKPSKLRFEQFAQQSQVNDAIRARAAERADLHYIDVVAPMLEDGKPGDLFVADNLHLSAQGYEIWTRAVRKALLPHADAGAETCQQQERQ